MPEDDGPDRASHPASVAAAGRAYNRGVDRPLVPAPLARGGSGAVVAPHHLATAAGLGILRAGGTAVDAAIAANAVLGVVMGSACGIGGDAFWLIWDAAAGRQLALNGSGRAGGLADPAALRARGFTRLPFRGPLTITVPGVVRSWADAHERFGRLPRADVLAPAIELALDGFPADEGFCHSVEASAAAFDEALGRAAAGWQAVYRPHGRAWRAGQRVRLPALAATLGRIADAGWDDFYAGQIAAGQAAALAAAGALVTADDFATHESTWTEPLAIDYRGVRVTTHPPNSSGIVALQVLRILERLTPPPATTFAPGDGGATGGADLRWVHAGIEATKLALADRDAHLTDPAFRDVPVAHLLDPAYAAELAGLIDPARAAAPPPATDPAGRRNDLAGGGRPRRERGQPHRVELRRLRVGDRRSRDRHRLPEPGQLLQPGPRPRERPRAREADAPHAPPRDALPRRAAVGRRRLDGRRRAAGDPRPGRLRARGRRSGRGHGRRRPALVPGAAAALRSAGRRGRRAALPRRAPRRPARPRPPPGRCRPVRRPARPLPRDRARRRRARPGRNARRGHRPALGRPAGGLVSPAVEEPRPFLAPGQRAAVLRRLGELREAQLVALDAAVRELAAEKPLRKRVDHGFWFAWYEGPRLGRREEGELAMLFTDVVVAIASGVCGIDVGRFGERLRPQPQGLGGLLGGLGGLLAPRPGRRLEEAAIGLIEQTTAPWNPRLGVVAAWNMACAIALHGRLDQRVEQALLAAWEKALGPVPA